MATSKKSTGKKSKDPMSSVGATPVNLLVRLANGEEKKIRDTCGLGLEKPLANYDPDTQSWKMFGDISLWGDCPLLLNLPPSGMTRSGVLFLQPAWEPITGETELLSWPTPTTQDYIERKSTQQTPGSMHSVGLGDAVKMWPTPTTQETEHPDATLTETGRRLSKDGKSSHSLGLADAARLWPTPTAVSRPMEGNVRLYRAKVQAGEMTEAEAEAILGKSVWEAQGKLPATWPTPTVDDASNVNPKPNRFRGLVAAVNEKNPYPTMSANGMGNTGSRQMLDKKIADGSITEEEKKAMSAGNGGKLNPMWVEWLMGFPLGWTDLED